MTVSDAVAWVLGSEPKARESDKVLLIMVWQKLGFFLSQSQEAKFYSMPSAESIRRVRQKLNEEGKYLPPAKIARQRRLKGYIMQQQSPGASVERTEKLINDQPKAISWLNEED